MSFLHKLFGGDAASHVPVAELAPAVAYERHTYALPPGTNLVFHGALCDTYVDCHVRLSMSEYFAAVDQSRGGGYHSAKFLLHGSKHDVILTLPKLQIIKHRYIHANLINQSYMELTAILHAPAEYQEVPKPAKPEQTDKTVTEQKDQPHAEPKLTD